MHFYSLLRYSDRRVHRTLPFAPKGEKFIQMTHFITRNVEFSRRTPK